MPPRKCLSINKTTNRKVILKCFARILGEILVQGQDNLGIVSERFRSIGNISRWLVNRFIWSARNSPTPPQDFYPHPDGIANPFNTFTPPLQILPSTQYLPRSTIQSFRLLRFTLIVSFREYYYWSTFAGVRWMRTSQHDIHENLFPIHYC